MTLKNRYVATTRASLSSHEVHLFDLWSVPHQFNWKWQYLVRYLTPLVNVLPALMRTYDAGRVTRGAGPMTTLKNRLFFDVSAALGLDNLLGLTMTLLCRAKRLTRETRWFGGCRDHEYLLQDRSVAPNIRLRRYSVQAKGCWQQGRRLLEMVAGHVDTMLNGLGSVTDPMLDAYMAGCGPLEAAACIGFGQRLDTQLVVRLRLKFSFVFQVPCLFFCAIAHEQGICSVEEARVKVRKGLQLRDTAIRNGRSNILDGVTLRLACGADNGFRRDLERFANSEIDNVSRDLAILLRDYCLGKVVTRKTEGMHGLIKGVQARKVMCFVV